MNYGSICSGIEAASVAWHPLGWRPQFFAEIDKFPSAVLAHHWPAVPNLGDFTKIGTQHGTIDVLVGGTPCQAFSVAGLRKGLDDPRGNLTLAFLALIERIRPRWVVWENVPGVLSIDDGRVFGAFLGGLGQLGYGFAYRVLDAQFFGVPQRRRRVFVVGHLGDWRRAAAVLFERHSLSGHPAPSRKAGKGTSHGIEIGPAGGRFTDTCPTLDARAKDGFIRNQLGAGAYVPEIVPVMGLDQEFNVSEEQLGTLKVGGRGGFCPPTIAFSAKDHGADALEDCSPTLRAGGHISSHANAGVMPAVAFESRFARNGRGAPSDVVPPLKAQSGETGKGDAAPLLATGMAVRRLTPRECERLQGFPDDYTLIPWRGKMAPDGPRYKALGNSMAVPVMRWIGERIAEVEQVQ